MGWLGNLQRVLLLLLAVMVWIGGWGPQAAIAIASPANQSMVMDVIVHLGTESGELEFVPDRLEFSTGKRYRLTLDNPSPLKHYFTAKDFADNIWTQKVEAGNVEVKGAIHELELKPGAEAEWVFIPMKPGTYALRCIVAGHTEGGMVGEIIVTP